MTLPNQDVTKGITNLFLNPTTGEEWDIVIDPDTKQLVTVSGIEYITQKVTQLLRMSQGEADTNMGYGIPYMTEIIGVKNPDLVAIKQIFIDTILDNETLNTLGVTDCEIESIELNKETRQLSIIDLRVTTSIGDVTIEELPL